MTTSKIKVQMPKGTQSVSVDGTQYEADSDGIVTIDNPAHVAPLVDGHGGVPLDDDGKPGSGQAAPLVMTDTFPREVELRPGEPARDLSSIIEETATRVGVSKDQWNALPASVRDTLVGYTIGVARGEIGDVRGIESARDDAVTERDALRDQVNALNDRIAVLETAANQPPPEPAKDEAPKDEGGKEPDAEAPEKPEFEKMTVAAINKWLAENGGEKAVGDQAFVAQAANDRWAVLHPAGPAA